MKKEKIVTLGLILMMIFLIGAIFYFSYLLMEAPTEEKTTSAVAPKKTKAQAATSEKFIALNQNSSSNPSPTSYLPTSTPTQTPTDNLVTKETPTPTEIILAKAETPTPLPSNNYYPSPTEVTTLPKSGIVHSILILFGVAAFFIFYSLVF
jgi:cytoskeletal protein RodZ